jgi:hypothetical protein
MARTPRSQWTEAYRKRIEREERRAAAEGRAPNRQKARGKRQGEHITRKQREELAGITSAQRAAIRKWVAAQADRVGKSEEETKAAQDKLINWAKLQGYDRFKKFRDRLGAREKAKRSMSAAQWKAEYYQEGFIGHLMEEFEIDDPDLDWLAYYTFST